MKQLLLVFALLSSLLPLMAAYHVDMNGAGNCAISRNGVACADINAGYYLPGWSSRGYATAFGVTPKGNTVDCLGGSKDDPARVQMHLDYKLVGDNAITLNYTFTPTADLDAHSLHATFGIQASCLHNRPIFVDGKQLCLVADKLMEPIHLFSGKAKTAQLTTEAGPIQVSFNVPTAFLIQDNRKWGTSVGIRIGAHREDTTLWKGNVPVKVSFTVTFPEPIIFDRDAPVTMAANDDWIPLNDKIDITAGSALDFTSVTKLDAPAGKYGWTKAVGQDFEFEKLPGVAQRFYGVNFCFGAHNITPEQSEILATRLARLGYNAVRYHHYERNICNRKIPGDSTQLDPVKMAQFDAMFAAMKRHGIYATTDLYVSRDVYVTEIWPDSKDPKALVPMQMYKRLVALNPAAMANWKKFARTLLTHVNPYTGISYAQDPALSLISLINEGTLDGFGQFNENTDPRLLAEWYRNWNAWLGKKYGSAQKRNEAWGTPDFPAVLNEYKYFRFKNTMAQRDLQQFLADLEIAMIQEMRTFLRDELGCKALITDINCGGKTAWAQLARSTMDYVDDHFYIDHPSFLVNPWQLPSRISNKSVIRKGAPGGVSCAFARIIDKPFTITEWNYAFPGRYRGVGGILTGCMASLQNWSGLWRFAYRHSSDMFKPASTGYFDVHADPLNRLADRACVCLYLRGDLPEAPVTIAATMNANYCQADGNPADFATIPQWSNLATLTKVGVNIGTKDTVVPADITVGYGKDAPKGNLALEGDITTSRSQETGKKLMDILRQKGYLPADNKTDLDSKITQSLDRQLVIDGPHDIMILNTARTAGCFAPAGNTVDTDCASFTILDTDATVWVSSLSDTPIRDAKRMVIMHLTDLQNTGARFNEKSRSTLLGYGKLPHLVRRGRAEITLHLAHPQQAKVYALDLAGNRLNEVPATATAEGLKITLSIKGSDGAQLAYEVTQP